MMRPRATEGPHKPSPRVGGPRHLRTSSSDSDPIHHRPITDKSPRFTQDRRSPRGARSDPIGQKKLGTRISDLETQLVQAQRELKSLKNQLVTAEAAKKEAQEELGKKTKKSTHPHSHHQAQGKQNTGEITEESNSDRENCSLNEMHKETDVFEVPMEKVALEPKPELEDKDHPDDGKSVVVNSSAKLSSQPPDVDGLEKPTSDELHLKSIEIDQLKAKLEETEKEREALSQENETLKSQLGEASSVIDAVKIKEEQMNLNHNILKKELEESKGTSASLKERLREVELAKEELEAEMKTMRVQTEQWRKAADAAASVLAGGVEVGGRVSERCGSMEKQFNGMFEPPPIMGGYPVGYMGSSPGAGEDFEDGFGNAKRKGSGGIKMFGDLWKKKGQR